MTNYFFQYDSTTGVIYPYLQESTPASSATMGILGPYPYDTASPTVVMAYNYPERFLAQGSPVELVEQPYFTLSAEESTTIIGQWNVTATLNNPPATPPTEATLNVLGQSFTEPMTNDQATFNVQLHASLANTPIHITAGATGCATSRPTIIGGQTSVNVGLQIYTPSGGVPTVAPTGTGSKAFLESYYALSPASFESLLADIGTAVSLLTDVVFNVLLPAVQQATYAPVSLSTNQENALSDVKSNVVPNLFTTLSNAFPSGGSKQLQYADYTADLAKTYEAFEQYTTDLQNIPNLA